MSRPQHLNCVNTVAGIRRINEEQREYDKDPNAYERREQEREECRRREEDEQLQTVEESTQEDY